MDVAREVGGDPVENHADPVAMERIDEVSEVVGRAKPRGRGKVPHRLISPASIKRMLINGQKLNVGKIRFFQMFDELVGKFVIGEEPISSSVFRFQEPRCTS